MGVMFFILPFLSLSGGELEEQGLDLEPSETAAQYVHVKTAPSCNKKSNKTNRDQEQMPEEDMVRSQSVITPSVAPRVMDGSDTYITLDFIWWKTVVGGMEYAVSGVVDNASFVTPFGMSTNKGHVQKPDFDFEPGIKVGMGLNFEHDGWDLYAQYTYLHSPNETTHASARPGVGVRNLQAVYYNDGTDRLIPIVNASCKWEQNLNLIDLELGRDYFISRYLTLRPCTGLKSGWITEQSKIHIIPTTTVPIDGGPLSTNRPTSIILKYRQNMWGIGIRTGLNAGWHISKNWLFYNDFAFSALWADFHVHQKQIMTETVGGVMTNEVTGETLQTIIPVLEAGLGLAYITWWEQSRYRFEVRGGWEEQIWLDFNHFMTLGGTGNLSLHGFTLKTVLNF